MTWKDNIGNYFTGKGIYRLDYTNNLLRNYLKEWIEYMTEFNGIHAHLTEKSPDKLSGKSWLCVTVSELFGLYFRAYLIYMVDEASGQISLKIKYNTDLDVMGGLNTPRESEEKYQWADPETFYGNEIFEEGFVLQLLNERFINFNNTTGLFR